MMTLMVGHELYEKISNDKDLAPLFGLSKKEKMTENRAGYVSAPELDEQKELTLSDVNINPARLDGESQEAYRTRRALGKKLVKQHLKGRLTYMSNVYFNGQLVTVAPPYTKNNTDQDGKEDNSGSAE
jgi:hypothetical protein